MIPIFNDFYNINKEQLQNGLSSDVENRGGKAIVEDLNRQSPGEGIGYKEFGPVQGGGQLHDFRWEDIKDLKGDLFIPENERFYTVILLLEGEYKAVNAGFNDGTLIYISSYVPQIKDREKNEGAP
ncbi:MAG: hypothetical protein LBE79_06900, partial [Tannerella sp.]|nr:hypothetical protein [Tannerella sp.]